MKKEVYFVEVGVLLNKDDEAFDCYSQAYNKKFGFYDEEQIYMSDMNKAIEYVTDYVKKGVPNTYGIVSVAWVDDEYFQSEEQLNKMTVCEKYNMDDVIYNVRKIEDGSIESEFLTEKESEEKEMKTSYKVGQVVTNQDVGTFTVAYKKGDYTLLINHNINSYNTYIVAYDLSGTEDNVTWSHGHYFQNDFNSACDFMNNNA